MACCSPRCKKITAFTVGGFFLFSAVICLIFFDDLYNWILRLELSLGPHSIAFNMWKETPIPMYLSIYMYNWTNSKEFLRDWNINPHFQQCGPYTWREVHTRVNLDWMKGDKIGFQTRRTWKFEPSMSNGSLDDPITNLNVIATTVGYTVRNRGAIIQTAVDMFLRAKEKNLAITNTVNQWVFEGFEDEILNFVHSLNITIDMPFDKFGWFYARNNSDTYDGNYTMYTGRNDLDLLGILEEWNGGPKTKYYESYCGFVNGTTGELWPPIKKYKKITIFSSDICSSINLYDSNKTDTIHGITGRRFVGTEEMFDNGTVYPEMGCFHGPDVMPSGVRDVSKCRYGAPAYISYPHFSLADPWYREAIDGMNPDPEEHGFSLALEPNTGVPITVKASLQINIMLHQIPGIKMFRKVKNTMIPMLWFTQTATMTEKYAKPIRMLLVLPDVGMYTGYGMLGLGILIVGISIYVTYRGAWKSQDEEELLPERSL